MKEKLNQIKTLTLEKLSSATDLKVLDEIRVEVLGKKGELTKILKGMKDLSKGERPVVGALVNEVRADIESAIRTTKEKLDRAELERKLREEDIDVTIPSKKQSLGKKHPMNVVLDDIKNIFLGMGYGIYDGPEIEENYYNFEALNIPEDHPARDEQDTFYLNRNYINKDFVLRTATSPSQIHAMESSKPPIKVIVPGRVFRSDEVDATHSPMFHQIEGIVIDKNITMANLKGTLNIFIKELYGEDAKTRFRPHYFPFTEPSAEVDVSCFKCKDEPKHDCPICRGSGWIEILGCGVVHPNVIKMAGLDPEVYSGFAFGMGLERITMLRYGIDDLRLFFENDLRFLGQF